MVHPLIYNTPEEKKNASQVYRRMYYERKKEEISVKMAAKYQAKKMANQIMDSGGASSIDISSPPHHDSSSASGQHMQTLPKLFCDVDDTEASLLTCSIFNTLYAQMIWGPGDQQIVLAMLSVHLEVLESIQEYASGSFTPQHISSNVCAMHSSRIGLRVGLKKKFCFLVTAVGVTVRKCHKDIKLYYTLSLRRYPRCPKAHALIIEYIWATKEQMEFLERFLPEYHGCMFNRNYGLVLKKVWREFFECWPERSIILAQVPADQEVTEEQESLLKAAVVK
ncbi:hypothetical protein EV424DRAFT_1351089 [Suillus variegatus]|nr:hypothetical protein EV424DRAFT_1351089 [Suillus variegatus]